MCLPQDDFYFIISLNVFCYICIGQLQSKLDFLCPVFRNIDIIRSVKQIGITSRKMILMTYLPILFCCIFSLCVSPPNTEWFEPPREYYLYESDWDGGVLGMRWIRMMSKCIDTRKYLFGWSEKFTGRPSIGMQSEWGGTGKERDAVWLPLFY